MRWPWSRPKPSVRVLADAQETRLRTAKEIGARVRERLIIEWLRGLPDMPHDPRMLAARLEHGEHRRPKKGAA